MTEPDGDDDAYYDSANTFRIETRAEGLLINITLSQDEIGRLLDDGTITFREGEEGVAFRSQVSVLDSDGRPMQFCRAEIHRGQ